MRFGRTLVSFIGLTVMLLSGELWLIQGLAAQQSRIVFSHLGFDNFEIYVMDGDGGSRENLSNHPVDDEDPDWSPDGTKIAFVSPRNGGGEYQIYVMDADGKNQIRLTDGPGAKREPDWSPDGQKIAFVSWRDERNEIYVIGADGQGLERVTHDLAPKWSPSFSPDGQRIAYWARTKNSITSMWWVWMVKTSKGLRTMKRIIGVPHGLPMEGRWHMRALMLFSSAQRFT